MTSGGLWETNSDRPNLRHALRCYPLLYGPLPNCNKPFPMYPNSFKSCHYNVKIMYTTLKYKGLNFHFQPKTHRPSRPEVTPRMWFLICVIGQKIAHNNIICDIYETRFVNELETIRKIQYARDIYWQIVSYQQIFHDIVLFPRLIAQAYCPSEDLRKTIFVITLVIKQALFVQRNLNHRRSRPGCPDQCLH